MAGPDPSGATDTDEARANLRAAMLMGLPPDPALRPIFYFPREQTFNPDDHGGQPLSWTQEPVTDSDVPGPPRVVTCGTDPGQILCAYEMGGGRGGTQPVESPFGDFDVQRVTITLLDVDRDVIYGFNKVVLGEQTFIPDVELVIYGLFELTVYQIVVQAVDAHVRSSS